MMNTSEAILTWSLRYLQGKYKNWFLRYMDDRYDTLYPNPAYLQGLESYGRYQAAIQLIYELETLVGGPFRDRGESLAAIRVCWERVNTHPDWVSGPLHSEGFRDELAQFWERVEALSPAEWAKVAPLPFRRRLTEEEGRPLQAAVWAKWDEERLLTEPFEGRGPAPVWVAPLKSFPEEDLKRLETELIGLSEERIWAVSLDRGHYEIESGQLKMTLLETIFVGRDLSWFATQTDHREILLGGEGLWKELEARAGDLMARFSSRA